MNFFGVGAAEAGVIFVIALIVIGPQRFPEIMRQAGRWYRIARAYSNEVMKDVRAAVDEIEQEVKAETDDLRSVRELTDLKGDLVEARESMEEIRKDTRSAAQAGSTNATPPVAATPASRTTTPSSTTPSTPAQSTEAEGTEGKPGAPAAGPGTSSASTPADPPASYYEGRDPSTYDPFKAKEARERERAAARDDASGDGASTNGTS